MGFNSAFKGLNSSYFRLWLVNSAVIVIRLLVLSYSN